jgi:hypothetical protein
MVDRTRQCATSWIKEIVKNQADYTIHNITGKQYDLYQGLDEDKLLQHVAKLNYEHAVVFSTGTEFINGREFFDAVEQLVTEEFFIAGHLLDRSDAYYELHPQCYVINLNSYKDYAYPEVGQQQLGNKHVQSVPKRSEDNLHDDYTPLWVHYGDYIREEYQHKCHGWNILSTAFNKQENVIVFGDNIRNNKIHLYPEYLLDFNKNIQSVYHREQYSATEFVHTANTEWGLDIKQKFKQVLTPASGLWYKNFIENDAKIIFYDYNKNALEYWKQQAPNASFVHLDLINGEFDIRNIVDMQLIDNTVINLSNVFCYEGTCHFYSTDYKIYRENAVLENLKQYAPNATILHSGRAAGAFDSKETLHGEMITVKSIVLSNTKDLKLPTWRITDIQ